MSHMDNPGMWCFLYRRTAAYHMDLLSGPVYALMDPHYNHFLLQPTFKEFRRMGQGLALSLGVTGSPNLSGKMWIFPIAERKDINGGYITVIQEMNPFPEILGR